MKSYYARANEIEGTSTDGSVVAYYCKAAQRIFSYITADFANMHEGRAYGFSKVVANMGTLSPGDKQELMQYMDLLENVGFSFLDYIITAYLTSWRHRAEQRGSA